MLAMAAPMDARGQDASLRARIEQEQLPAWQAREVTANRRVEARRAWFNGRGPFEAAFPGLRSTPDRRELLARLALLDREGVARAHDRSLSPPAVDPPVRQAWTRAREAMLVAEEAADLLERRLLEGLIAALEVHPELAPERVAARIAPWTARAAPPETEDPDRLAEAAAAAREVERFQSLILAILLHRVGPGAAPDPALDVARVRARLAGEATDGDADAAVARLELLAPTLADRAAVDEVLDRWWTERGVARARAELEAAEAAAAAPVDGPVAPEVLASLEEAVTAASSALEASRGGPEGAVLAAELRVEARRIALEAARRSLPSAAGESVRLAQEEAHRAAEEAEAARASAEDAEDRRRAEVLAAVARASERVASLEAEAEGARQQTKQATFALTERVDALRAQIREVQNRSAFDLERPTPDAVYRALRELTTELRGAPTSRGIDLDAAQALRDRAGQRVVADRDSRAAAQILLESTEDPEARARLGRALQDWDATLDRELEAAADRVTIATTARDQTLEALRAVRHARRELAPWISAGERLRDRSYLLEDIGQEVALVGPSVVTRARVRARDLGGAPASLLDFNVLQRLIVGSIWTFVLVGAWMWSRGEVAHAARWATERLGRLRPELRDADLLALRAPFAEFLRSFVDLVLGWLLVGRVAALVPEFGFLLLVYLQVALYRALLSFYDLVVVRTSDLRPGVLVLRGDEHDMGRLTVRVGLGFAIVRRFTVYLLWEVLGLDVITRVAQFGFVVLGMALATWLLHAWEPFLRARIARRARVAHRAVAWLAREDASAVLRVVRAMGILGFFAMAWVVDLVYLLARERSSVGRLFNAVNRYRLTDGDEPFVALPDAVATRIVGGRTPAEHVVDRPEVAPAIAEALQHWTVHRRQGLVAVVGDRGEGKRTVCARIARQLAEAALPPRMAYLDRALVTESDALTWLASVAGLPAPSDADALVVALEELPPAAWVLEGAHRSFARRVEGFAALATLLYVLNATCDRHFWVVSMHRPAWEFLVSATSVVDMAVFRTILVLQPMTSAQLRALAVTRTELAGLRVNLSALARPSALGGDPSVDEERGINLFFRLLGEASDGNPKVALDLWARCLQPGEGQEVRVHLSAALSTSVIASLTDPALFVLVAVRMQDELDEAEIARVTNLPHGAVRATVRDLINRGLLQRVEGDRVRIPDARLPSVTRTLRRRHFLHLGA